MKSKQPDEHLQTSCKECVFASYEGDTQTGCLAGRIEMFDKQIIEAYDDDKEFYVIDAYCNYFRPPKWNAGKPDVDRASRETNPSVCIAVYTDNISEMNLRKTVDSLSKIKYDKSRLRVVLSQVMTADMSKKKLTTKMYEAIKRLGIDAKVVTVFTEDLRDHDTLKTQNMGYIVKIKTGDSIPEDMFKKINTSLNEKLKRAVVFESNKVIAISMMAFRLGFHGFKSYDKFEREVRKEAEEIGLFVNVT